MTLEESRDVIPIMEEMISLIEEQERLLSETSKELEQIHTYLYSGRKTGIN